MAFATVASVKAAVLHAAVVQVDVQDSGGPSLDTVEVGCTLDLPDATRGQLLQRHSLPLRPRQRRSS